MPNLSTPLFLLGPALLGLLIALCLCFGQATGQTAEARAAALIQQGEYAEAAVLLEHAAQNSPSPRVWKLLALARLALDQKAEAIAHLQKFVRLVANDAEGWSLLGILQQDANRLPQAVEALNKSLALKPDNVPALTALAFSQFGLGEYDRALATYGRALARNRQLPVPLAEPHASLAIALLRLHRVREAEQQVREAVRLNPRHGLTQEAQRALQARLRATDKSSPAQPAAIFAPPQFAEVAAAAGLNFQLNHSPTPAKHQIETMPGGVAVLDFNRDGLMDLYFANGAESPALNKRGEKDWNRLYRNDGDWKFTDVTASAGVAGAGYAMGVAAADFDNDGWPDLFVAGVGRNQLFRNNGDGTFADVTGRAGLNQPHARFGAMWAVHGAWFDYDNDGWLDLLVVNYCQWNPATEVYCGEQRPSYRTYCHPDKYGPLPNQLFRNNHDGTFTDVSLSSGIGAKLGKGMGASVADCDGDGWMDVFIANDTMPNFLFRNEGNGRFSEIALASGVAVNQFGSPVSGMGADWRDYDNDGYPDLFITALSHEGFLLFRHGGRADALFDDVADAARLSLPSLPLSGWSNAIADFNNDGWKDLFAANGHVSDNIELTQSLTYRQRNLLMLNRGDGTFRDVSAEAGAGFQRTAAHRGAAIADFDNDGKLDLVVTALGERPSLLRNTTRVVGNWLTVQLTGKQSNRDGIGASLKLATEDGRTLWNQASPSVGYASSSDPRVCFGLGSAALIRRLEIRWPSGKRQIMTGVHANQLLRVEEN